MSLWACKPKNRNLAIGTAEFAGETLLQLQEEVLLLIQTQTFCWSETSKDHTSLAFTQGRMHSAEHAWAGFPRTSQLAPGEERGYLFAKQKQQLFGAVRMWKVFWRNRRFLKLYWPSPWKRVQYFNPAGVVLSVTKPFCLSFALFFIFYFLVFLSSIPDSKTHRGGMWRFACAGYPHPNCGWYFAREALSPLAYLLWCYCIEYSFFGSQTSGQTGVRVGRVSGHNSLCHVLAWSRTSLAQSTADVRNQTGMQQISSFLFCSFYCCFLTKDE